MRYYLKKLGSQELGSVKDGRAQRGRYIYISKDNDVLDLFPPLSKVVKNDASLIPVIPLYIDEPRKVYCSFVYHNDKYNQINGTRNEYRIYSNNELEDHKLLFQPDDILIFRDEIASTILDNNDGNGDQFDFAVTNAKVYFLYRCVNNGSAFYRECREIVDNSHIRGGGHAIFDGEFPEVETEVDRITDIAKGEYETAIDETVTARTRTEATDAMASLFNSVSFHDFVMVGYEFRCAVTNRVIRYGNYMNLEAAHIWPRSHDGCYLPNNGIALSRDMHWAFDKGRFTIDDDYKIRVHPDIESDYLRQYDNNAIFLPNDGFFRPNLINLHYHQRNVFGLFKTAGSLTQATRIV